MSTKVPKMRAALRHLCAQGEMAMMASKDGERWRKAVVSKRVAADLRKKALREGTYGAFDRKTGVGWDPKWDDPGRMPSYMRPPRTSREHRTREDRALKIEAKMADMPKLIQDHRDFMKKSRPEKTFENKYKELMKGK